MDQNNEDILTNQKKQKSSLVSSVKKAFSTINYPKDKDSDSGRDSSESESSSKDLRKKCRRSKNNFTNSSKYYINNSLNIIKESANYLSGNYKSI